MIFNEKQLNVSNKYKFVWWAPERTASRTVAEILSYYGFTCDGLPIYQFGEFSHRHTCYLTNGIQEYHIICGARNPYDRTLSIFKNFFQSNEDKTVLNFQNFIKNKLESDPILNMIQRPIFVKIPNYIIKLESLKEDIMKLPFINDVLTERQIDLILMHDKPKRDWESYYDEETKKIVYKYTRHHFDIFGYER